MIDPKLQQELREKYNPDGSNLRKAQLRMTEMLVFLDIICTKYNLRYWLDSGTLLGAVRHGGFIPWDDDTDVCMPIEDLHKLRKIMASEHLSDEFVLQTPQSDKNYMRIEWCTLRDLKSEYIHDEENVNRFDSKLKYRGLQIDLFPMETGVNPKLKRISNALQGRLMSNWITNPKIPFDKGVIIARMGRWILTEVVNPFFRLFKSKKTLDCYLAAYGCPLVTKRYVKNIYPLRKIKYEGLFFNAPQNTHAYLTDLYGDWKTLPPTESIVTHKVNIFFLSDMNMVGES